MKRTVKCPICSEPYQVFDMTDAYQFVCPDCIKTGELLKRMDQIKTKLKAHNRRISRDNS